jgi:hypothetical protein
MVEEILKRIPERWRLWWRWWASIDEHGNIHFEGVALFPKGFWKRVEREPFFNDELRKGIKRALFRYDPDFDVHVCGSGMTCGIDENGRGVFEFEVRDVKKNRVVFRGVARGNCLMGTGIEAYVECIIHTITLEPVEE